jgi:hypothetical protein
MSTKCSFASGPNFHFYEDLLDPDAVYLELTGAEYECTSGHVKVGIPLAVWEVIRQYAGVDLALVNKTDDELLHMVEAEVARRIQKYATASMQEKKFLYLHRGMIYGAASDSRDAQIASGLKWFGELRERQSRIKLEVDQMTEMQRNLEPT